MAMIDEERLRLMTWNIKSGGFDHYGESHDKPPRGNAIQKFIKDRTSDYKLDGTAVIDAERWQELYGGDAGIARHLGYRAARFTYLNDDRLKADHGADIGVAFATNLEVLFSAPLDLETRQGLNVIVDKNGRDIQIASVYLDDVSADVRERQVKALLNDLEPNMPTVIMGDMNSLRQDIGHIERRLYQRDALYRAAAHVALNTSRLFRLKGGLVQSVGEMPLKPVDVQMAKAGFRDADPDGMPTYSGSFPFAGIDYIFTNDHLFTESKLVDGRGPSDHRAVIASIAHRSGNVTYLDEARERRKYLRPLK